MAEAIEVLSPAKINLTLDVLGKRQDGFHNLDSIVQTINLFDRLILKRRRSSQISLTCSREDVPMGDDNIIVKACNLMRQMGLWNGGLDIDLQKSIPMKAGLGGGSSNAAAVLAGIDRLFGLGLRTEQLAEIGARLGSDVALFAYGGTVRMTGRGDVIRPLGDGIRLYYVIVKPECSVSTAWAYDELDKRQLRKDSAASDRAESAYLDGDAEGLVKALHNDFQDVVDRLFPEVVDIEKRLCEGGADKVVLAGSGSAVAGVFVDQKSCVSCYEKLRAEYEEIWVCSSLKRCEGILER